MAFSIYFFLVFTLLWRQGLSISAYPEIIKDTQADGTTVGVFLLGDEHHNWFEDAHGFLVLQKPVKVPALASSLLPPAAGHVGPFEAASSSSGAPALGATIAPAAAGVDVPLIGSIAQQNAAAATTTAAPVVAAVPPKLSSQYVYAAVDAQGQAVETPYVVGAVDPLALPASAGVAGPGVNEHLLHQYRRSAAERAQTGRRQARDTSSRPMPPKTGKVTNLVIMVRWADDVFRTDLPTVAQMDVLFNSRAPNNSPSSSATDALSVRDAVLTNSYGQLEVNSVFSDWIDVSISQDEAAQGTSGLVGGNIQNALRYALMVADARLDLAQFDANNDGAVDLVTV